MKVILFMEEEFVKRRVKKSVTLFDLFMLVITGGVWIFWLFIRYWRNSR